MHKKNHNFIFLLQDINYNWTFRERYIKCKEITDNLLQINLLGLNMN